MDQTKEVLVARLECAWSQPENGVHPLIQPNHTTWQIITLSVAHTRMKLPVTSLVAIAVATGITWLAMLLVARFGGKPGGGGFLRDTLTRFMGLIVLSVGVQFALTGYYEFMK
jgi:multiple antibiotic resistance protein